MRKNRILFALAGASVLGGVILAQEPAADVAAADQAPAAQTPATQTPATQTAAPAPAPTPPKSDFTQGGMDFSFLFDGYVNGNFNNPNSGFNGLRNFDVRANNAHVSLGKITIDRAAAPVGFHLDVGFGQTINMVGASDRAPQGFKYFEQAYVSFKPKSFHGLQVDVGKFVTSAGAEVIESNANWNYSRSLLFAWAIPYYHFGVRTSFPDRRPLHRRRPGGAGLEQRLRQQQRKDGWPDGGICLEEGNLVATTTTLARRNITPLTESVTSMIRPCS